MTDLEFKSRGHLTVGVEIELQLIDPNNMDLFPMALDILKYVDPTDKIKPEIFQSMIEVNSNICHNVHEIKDDVQKTLIKLNNIGRKLNITYSTTGTHPFAEYVQRLPFPSKRYDQLIERNQWIARRLCIFGLHVHLGMETREECISFMNFYQHFLPHLIALSASSPFWQGHNTGLASSRLTVFEASPTSGHLPWMKSWQEFEEQYQALVKCQAIQSIKDLWWDMRPSPHYGTLEIRICDGCATLHELLAIVAFIHGLAHWYRSLSPAEKLSIEYVNPLPLWNIRENKWRALRYGLDMDIVKGDVIVPIKHDIMKIINMMNDVFDMLGYQIYKEYILKIINNGNSSIRQLENYAQYQSLEKVTAMNVDEFEQSFIFDNIRI